LTNFSQRERGSTGIYQREKMTQQYRLAQFTLRRSIPTHCRTTSCYPAYASRISVSRTSAFRCKSSYMNIANHAGSCAPNNQSIRTYYHLEDKHRISHNGNEFVPSKNNNEMNQEMDFFDEPVTFILNKNTPNNSKNAQTAPSIQESMLSLDTFTLQYISRGKAYNEGGNEFGITEQASHSAAIPWSDLFRHLAHYCYKEEELCSETSQRKKVWKCQVPMMACTALSPILALGGVSYLHHLDQSYFKSINVSFITMAKAAISSVCMEETHNTQKISIREMYHLRTLHFLLQNEHSKALHTLSKLLEKCPGDTFGLTLALDIASVLNDRQTAFRIATSVASYWKERGSRRSVSGQASIQGYGIGSSLIGLGLAVGGRFREAEELVEIALQRDTSSSSGVAAWTLANIYDGEGRVSEGTSVFTGYGKEYYENCGFMFFDAFLAGVGGRFILDRDGANADNIAIRLYDESFARIIEYSGYDDEMKGPVYKPVPESRQQMLVNSATGAASSVFNKLFGGKADENQTEQHHSESKEDESTKEDVRYDNITKSPSLEDILTWLPPTSHLLTNAMFDGIINETARR